MALAKRSVAQDEMLFVDAFGQMRVSKALFQHKGCPSELCREKGTVVGAAFITLYSGLTTFMFYSLYHIIAEALYGSI